MFGTFRHAAMAAALLVMVLAPSTLGADSTSAPSDDGKWAGERPPKIFCWPPIPEDASLRRLRYDRRFVELGPGVAARRVRGRRDTWAVDYTWCTSAGLPGKLFTPATIISMGEIQGVPDNATVELFTGRFLVQAKHESLLVRTIEDRLARGVPDPFLAKARSVTTPGRAEAAPADTARPDH